MYVFLFFFIVLGCYLTLLSWCMIFKEWAAADGKESPVNPATIKYTDFLLATASGKIEGAEGLGNLATPFERTKLAAYALGAMTPCMRLYAYLATEFKGVLGALHGDHPYKTWIENYASKGFEVGNFEL